MPACKEGGVVGREAACQESTESTGELKAEWPIILNSNAHIFWPKGAQKCAHPNFSKKRTNAHIFWPKGAQKCAHQKFWLKVHNSISRLKNVFF